MAVLTRFLIVVGSLAVASVAPAGDAISSDETLNIEGPKGRSKVTLMLMADGPSAVMVSNAYRDGEQLELIEARMVSRPEVIWYTDKYLELRMSNAAGQTASIFYDLRANRKSFPIRGAMTFDPQYRIAATNDDVPRLVSVFDMDKSGEYYRYNSIDLSPTLPKTYSKSPNVNNAAFDRDGNFSIDVEVRPAVWLGVKIEQRYIEF